MASLRSLLRLVPCSLRSSVVDYVRRTPPGEANANMLREAQYLLKSHRHLQELNEKYFPQSGMSQQEVVAATAARVGFRMPQQAGESPPTDAKGP